MFERSKKGDQAILLHPEIDGDPIGDTAAEFHELASAAGAQVLELVRAPRSRPDAALFVGSGKVDEVGEKVRASGADLVLVNHLLSPIQERNLERALQCRVHDRTALILDIFAQRAVTHEGKLQVELAQLRHLSTRLVRGWTHLERQKGGIGLRGPGETQLETDRRLLADRVKSLKRRLERVRRQRAQTRRARNRSGVANVSLVGYTNAGKSTLFNALTSGTVLAADQLFATLDPTRRRLGDNIVLADTVGFIRHLPHDLVAAFRATLEETLDADLVIHVIDASAPDREELMAAVDEVLTDIGAAELPRLNVFNKIDQTELAPGIRRDEQGSPRSVFVSAITGAGLTDLKDAVGERLNGQMMDGWLTLAPEQGRLRAELYQRGCVTEEQHDDSGNVRLHLNLAVADFAKLSGRSAEMRVALGSMTDVLGSPRPLQ